jgi:hypothetical protein
MWVGETTLDDKRGGVHCLQKLAMLNPLKFNEPSHLSFNFVKLLKFEIV